MVLEGTAQRPDTPQTVVGLGIRPALKEDRRGARRLPVRGRLKKSRLISLSYKAMSWTCGDPHSEGRMGTLGTLGTLVNQPQTERRSAVHERFRECKPGFRSDAGQRSAYRGKNSGEFLPKEKALLSSPCPWTVVPATQTPTCYCIRRSHV
jgi:hypothetical protein